MDSFESIFNSMLHTSDEELKERAQKYVNKNLKTIDTSAALIAISQLLIDKGIISDKEFEETAKRMKLVILDSTKKAVLAEIDKAILDTDEAFFIEENQKIRAYFIEIIDNIIKEV